MNKKILLFAALFSGIMCSCGDSTITSENTSFESENTSSSNTFSSSESSSSYFETSSNTIEEDNKVNVIIIAGQSNAMGSSRWKEWQEDGNGKINLTSEEVSKYQEGFSSCEISYKLFDKNDKEYLHTNEVNGNITFEKVKLGYGYNGLYFGPEIGIAEKINELNLGKTSYIIKVASGASSLCEDWLSPTSGTAGDTYNQFIPFVERSLKVLEDRNLKPIIKAVCWMQGEADSWEDTVGYETNEDNLIKDIKNHFVNYFDEDDMKFIDAAISSCNDASGNKVWPGYDAINKAKRMNALKDPLNRIFIDTNAEGLKNDPKSLNGGDNYHYEANSALKLGHLFGDIVVKKGKLK